MKNTKLLRLRKSGTHFLLMTLIVLSCNLPTAAATLAPTPTVEPPTPTAPPTQVQPTQPRSSPIAPTPPNPSTGGSAKCSNTSTGFIPLTDLGVKDYKGSQGGLYPNGSNQPSTNYLQIGLERAKKIQPLNRDGQPDGNGRIVLLSIGMSNTTAEYSEFKRIADSDSQKNPRVVIVDGAIGGADAELIKNPDERYWSMMADRIRRAAMTDKQVQAIWLKEAIAGERNQFPQDAKRLQNDLQAIVQILQNKFPNLQIIYFSSRIYAGYASSTLNPEPYSYQSGFAVKWLIEDRIKSSSGAYLAWGPYLWTDGTKGRSDGLVWECADVRSDDGTHPSQSGIKKVAELLLKLFKNDETAKVWFVK